MVKILILFKLIQHFLYSVFHQRLAMVSFFFEKFMLASPSLLCCFLLSCCCRFSCLLLINIIIIIISSISYVSIAAAVFIFLLKYSAFDTRISVAAGVLFTGGGTMLAINSSPVVYLLEDRKDIYL
jgi:hypothetical protein